MVNKISNAPYNDVEEEVVEVRVGNEIIEVEVADKQRVSMANSNLMNVMQQVVDYQEKQHIERDEEEQAIRQEIEEQKYEDGYQQQDHQYDDNNY